MAPPFLFTTSEKSKVEQNEEKTSNLINQALSMSPPFLFSTAEAPSKSD